MKRNISMSRELRRFLPARRPRAFEKMFGCSDKNFVTRPNIFPRSLVITVAIQLCRVVLRARHAFGVPGVRVPRQSFRHHIPVSFAPLRWCARGACWLYRRFFFNRPEGPRAPSELPCQTRGTTMKLHLRHSYSFFTPLLLLATVYVAVQVSYAAPQSQENASTSFSTLRSQAEQGDAVAQYNLARSYLRHDPTQEDYQSALKWLRASTAQGNAGAEFLLGFLYEHGLGVPGIMPRPRRTTVPRHSRATRPPKTIWPRCISTARAFGGTWARRSGGISLPPSTGIPSANAIWQYFTTWVRVPPAITKKRPGGFAQQPNQDSRRLKTVWGFLTTKAWASNSITPKLPNGCALPRNTACPARKQT